MSVPFPKGKDNLVIENIQPTVNCGQYPLKREPLDWVTVQADIFRHSHEKFGANILFRHSFNKKWERVPMTFVDNDLWEGKFQVKTIGFYEYRVEAYTIEPKDVPTLSPIFEVRVDPIYARRGSLYEMFPRNTSQGNGEKPVTGKAPKKV